MKGSINGQAVIVMIDPGATHIISPNLQFEHWENKGMGDEIAWARGLVEKEDYLPLSSNYWAIQI